ncbi:MAG: glucose-6-phosphate isomerase [Planctomycetota bacterium]
MSDLQFDYTNVLADVIGSEHGLTEDQLAGFAERSGQALERVQARRTQDLRWMDLPYQTDVVDAIEAYARSVEGRFETVVVLGIGGSALGNTALYQSLNGPFPEGRSDRRKLVVLDNVDPELIGPFLERVDPRTTLFNVISKSGGTAETMSQFLLVRELLLKSGIDDWKDHLVITTDAEKGVLRQIVDREGFQSFVVPDGVGGRFSVLCPVGLVSSALIGIDIRQLLAGAAHMDQRCKGAEFFQNPDQVHAAVQTLLHLEKHKPMAVTFSYSHRLKDFADWYAQLLAESIGKKHDIDGREVFAGPTPIRAVGVTDQHSQVQLYTEGPFDKWFTLLSVAEPTHRVTLPSAYEDLEGVAYLGGHSMSALFDAERDGTRVALTDAGRPNATLTLPKIDEHSIGQFIALFELSVALMGEHYRINAFDQPGVEAGKIAAYALMGRAGYEARRAEIEAAGAGRTPRFV